MEADGAPPPVTGGAMAFDPAKKTIAELKAWLTEQGEENQVRPSNGAQKAVAELESLVDQAGRGSRVGSMELP